MLGCRGTEVTHSFNKLFILLALSSLSACGGSSQSDSDNQNQNNASDNGEQVSNDTHAFNISVEDGLDPLLTNKPDDSEHLSAGLATTNIIDNNAYSKAIPAIVETPQLDAVFKAGDHTFRGNHDGQGPLFNNTSCQGCHIKDGRGQVPASIDEPMMSMFLRVGDNLGNVDPIYGDQIQVFGTVEGQSTAVLAKYRGALDEGLAYAEAYTWVEYETITGSFADGQSYELRKPIYKIKDLAYGEFMENVQFSPRVTPHVYGSGLLESIPQQSLLAYEDPNDNDKDGISGRAAFTTHPVTGERQIARFGQKAVTGSVLQQISGAYRGDMGITNTINPDEPCTEAQEACIAQAALENNKHHDGVDLNNVDLAQVEFYNRTLAVPKRRGFEASTQTWQADILVGREQFYAAKCHACHVPRHKTGVAPGSVLGDVDLVGLSESRTNITALEQQVIYPYTDLLLHDMGGSCRVTKELADGQSCTQGQQCIYVQRCEGLADGRPEGDATGTEWKTPALWGLGLVQTVNPKATFLHDGRARTIQEAILWHDGEAKASQQAFINMDKVQRSALLAFLGSL
ncbi:thiol oxidoreductase [Pseudoalteromonas sp. JBTF-M23]|uniref:Thiol oxidoreductase n=2 Tax=Pseudoalteromonas caenipelagi TaxID=2726988 RepID=A0A849VC04_9GAMM|nr:thiol oxidoreductase [Pseudoalteromonas caenipelagi]